jgi:hypothetical protein
LESESGEMLEFTMLRSTRCVLTLALLKFRVPPQHASALGNHSVFGLDEKHRGTIRPWFLNQFCSILSFSGSRTGATYVLLSLCKAAIVPGVQIFNGNHARELEPCNSEIQPEVSITSVDRDQQRFHKQSTGRGPVASDLLPHCPNIPG